MKRFRHLIALAVVAAGSYLVTTTSSAATTKPVLSFATATAPTNLNPAIDIDDDVLSLAYASIIHITPSGQSAPGLATSWGYVGNGNRTFEFTLRNNARFSDGTPVTAQAVKRWMIYFSSAPGAFAKNIPCSSIQTVGRWKVVIHLSTPTPIMPYLLSEPDMSGFVGSSKTL